MIGGWTSTSCSLEPRDWTTSCSYVRLALNSLQRVRRRHCENNLQSLPDVRAGTPSHDDIAGSFGALEQVVPSSMPELELEHAHRALLYDAVAIIGDTNQLQTTLGSQSRLP